MCIKNIQRLRIPRIAQPHNQCVLHSSIAHLSFIADCSLFVSHKQHYSAALEKYMYILDVTATAYYDIVCTMYVRMNECMLNTKYWSKLSLWVATTMQCTCARNNILQHGSTPSCYCALFNTSCT